MKEPFFSLPSREASTVGAYHDESPARRVWLPSRRRSALSILGSLFQLPTLLGFALRSFPPTRWSNQAFPLNRSALTLPQQTSRACCRRSSGFLPSGKPCPSLLPEGLVRVGTSAPLGFLASWALPPPKMDPESLSPNLPSRLFQLADLTINNLPDLRVCHSGGLAFSLRRGRRPIWPFPPTAVHNPFKL